MNDQQNMTINELQEKLVAKVWQDEAFKQELINNPKAVIERELGKKLPESLNIQVLEETGHTFYFVLPKKPTNELSEEQLEAVAGGGPIGAAVGGVIGAITGAASGSPGVSALDVLSGAAAGATIGAIAPTP
jgi:hypothetical protein